MVFLEYLPGDSVFHRMDVRPKLMWFILVTAFSLMFWDPLILGGVLALVLLIGLLIKIPYTKFGTLLRALIVPMIFIVGFQTVATPGHALFYVIPSLGLIGPWIPVTLEGVVVGFVFLFRILIMVFSSSMLTLTTPLYHFLALLRRLRFPYQLAFVITTGIRFIPVLEKEAIMTIEAQKARGADIEASKGFMQTIRAHVPILLPMLINAVRRSDNLAMAMVARGFGASDKWTTLYEIKAKGWDYVYTILFVALLCFGLYIYHLGYGVQPPKLWG